MIIDTHCHYNLEPLWPNWQEHWQKAQTEGVAKSIVVGTDLLTSSAAVQIATSTDNLFAAVGFHPNVYDETVTNTLQTNGTFGEVMGNIETDIWELNNLFTTSKVVAIGETGLDYFHMATADIAEETKHFIRQAQQEAFRQHIKVAQETQLPLIIHCRDRTEQAYWDVLQILKEMAFDGQFILHCISGPVAYIQQALKMGAYYGMAGNVTYKNAENIRDLVRAVPQDRLLLETDAPFLPPQEFRGKRCEPWMIRQTAEFVENELNISQAQLIENTDRFFPKLEKLAKS
jgi:TatD DNase family protein